MYETRSKFGDGNGRLDGGGRSGGISGAGRQFARRIGVVIAIMNGNETFAPSIRVLFGISQMIRSAGLNECVFSSLQRFDDVS